MMMMMMCLPATLRKVLQFNKTVEISGHACSVIHE